MSPANGYRLHLHSGSGFIVLVDRARRIGIEQSHCHGQNQKYRDKSLLAEVPRDLQERRVHCRTPLFLPI